MNISIFLWAIILAVFMQPSLGRFFAASVFASVAFTHDHLFADSTGLLYYGSAALSASMVIIFTSFFKHTPRMVITLHKVCFVAILVNVLGFILWYAYLSPAVYNLAFLAIYIWAIFALVSREGRDERRDGQLNKWRPGVFSNWYSFINPTIKDESKI